MRQLRIPTIIFASLLFAGMGARASARYQPQNNDRYDRSLGAYSGRDFRDNQILFARVRSDLDRAENNLPEVSYNRDRFDRARGELSELQRQWDEATYLPRQSDVVIGALDRVLSSHDLLPRDRDRLTADLHALQDFRDSHE